MAMVELSDLYGMVKQMANRLNVTIEDIDAMSKATTDAFASKSRPSFGTSKDWLNWIFANTSSYSTKERSTQFKVLDDTYIVFTETAFAPCVSTGGLRVDYTHIFELLEGEAYFYGDKTPILKGNVYHQDSRTISCQAGSIVRITSTRKGEAYFYGDKTPILKGNVYHQDSRTISCQAGSIVRITSTRKGGKPEMSKGAEQEFIKIRDKIKQSFGV
jgi:ribosomal protein S17